MAELAARALLLLGLTVACGGKEEGSPPADLPAVEATPVELPAVISQDAQQREPTREEAASVVRDFAEALLATPSGDLTRSLRIPEGYSEQQLANFYKELRRKHVTRSGVESVLQKDFGPIADRMGDKAESVADQAGLALGETWAFGDLESAVVLHWDGSRFWVASVHKLLAPK